MFTSMSNREEKPIGGIPVSKKVFSVLLFVSVAVISIVGIVASNPHLTFSRSFTQIFQVLLFPLTLIMLGTWFIFSVISYFATRDIEREKKNRKNICISLIVLVSGVIILYGILFVITSGLDITDYPDHSAPVVNLNL